MGHRHNNRFAEAEPLVIETARTAQDALGEGNDVTQVAHDNLSYLSAR